MTIKPATRSLLRIAEKHNDQIFNDLSPKTRVDDAMNDAHTDAQADVTWRILTDQTEWDQAFFRRWVTQRTLANEPQWDS